MRRWCASCCCRAKASTCVCPRWARADAPALALVNNEAPGLDRTTTRRVAAVVQLLTTASTWQTLTQYWDVDGDEAAETAALAIELLLDAARNRAN